MSLEDDDIDVDSSSSSSKRLDIVRLISGQGHEFIIDRECAMASGTIRALLTGPGTWAEQSGPIPTIHLDTLSSSILERVCQYFYYKKRYDHTTPPLPPFKLETENIVKLLLAANYLDT